MPNITTYTDSVKLILSESAKYFILLLLSVLAIRLWRQYLKTSAGANKRNFLVFACLVSGLAAFVGFASIRHSLGRLYSYYGVKAFKAGNIMPALSLFRTSVQCWENADSLGEQGVCLLWLDQTNQGLQLLDRAKTLRKGQNTAFEEYYEGLYFYFHDQWGAAIPLLESASGDIAYQWNITKLFAVIELENNRPEEAQKLMKPFEQAAVTDYDQAYIIASLDLWNGKKAEAEALAKKYRSENLPPFWKTRFDQLGVKIQNQTP